MHSQLSPRIVVIAEHLITMIKLLSVLLYSFIIPTGTLTQTTVAQCEKTICPTLDCKNPIRLDGECCDRCGESKGLELCCSSMHDCFTINKL